ncbi:MAG TPA: ABC transporter permease [Bdellovibrionales bacterium]|nr:ABC transporter permease [Bdellovibrionales bacterium]
MKSQASRRSSLSMLGWIPVLWYLVFLIGPLVFVGITAFATRGTYGGIEWIWTAESFSRAFDPLYAQILNRSIYLALGTTIACGVLGFPMALAMATAPRATRSTLVFLLAIPFLTNLVIRICALKVFTGFEGPLAMVLTIFGVDFDPYQLSQNRPLVIFGMVSTYLPFMVFPLFAALEKFDFSLLEAAQDLGATFWQSMRKVLLPILKPAMISGSLLVFIPAMGEFLIPDLLGGAKTMLAGNLISEQFLKARDWPFGSALSALLMMSLGLFVFFVRFFSREQKEAK